MATVSTYSNYTSNPNPNTQPIYPRVPISWRKRLTNQVTTLSLNGGSETPVFMGSASESGCILECWTISSLITPGGGGGGSGSESPDGDFGLGTVDDPLNVRLYSKPFGEETYYLIYELSAATELVPTRRSSAGRMGFPILPSPQTALRFAPFESLYVSLNKAIVTPGLDFFVYGGQYS